jgi:acetolactate decarboxylase
MRIRLVTLALAVASLVASPIPAASAVERTPGELVQVGTFTSLTQPDFRGLATIGSVLTDETLGLGTFDNLDGEFVMVGGVAYQIKTDGVPRPIRRDQMTPFLQAIRFQPEVGGPIPPGTRCDQLTPIINALAGSSNGVVGVRVRGTFTDLVTRSVSPVPPPFKPISEVVANQTVFPLGTVKAVLVGFQQGPDALGVGQPGLHLHGVTASRNAGGHVLSCVAGPDVHIAIDRVSNIRLITPSTGGAASSR